MEQGPTEAQILEACYTRGVPPPESIQNAPELLGGLSLYYEAFFDLDTCRSEGGGRIPWTAMETYAARLGIEDGDDFDRFVYLIREMDQECLGVLKSKANKGGTSGKS